MTTQDLSNNKERIIRNIKKQITGCTKNNVVDVMNKMISLLPQFEDKKPLMKNIDELTYKATISYIKYGISFTVKQNEAIDIKIEEDRNPNVLLTV